MGGVFHADNALLFAVALQCLFRLGELLLQPRELVLQPGGRSQRHLVAGIEIIFDVGLCHRIGDTRSQCRVGRGVADDDQLAQANRLDREVSTEATQYRFGQRFVVPLAGLFLGGKTDLADECSNTFLGRAGVVVGQVVELELGNGFEADLARLENFYLCLKVLA